MTASGDNSLQQIASTRVNESLAGPSQHRV